MVAPAILALAGLIILQSRLLPETDVAEDDGIVRVVLLGDSVAHGAGDERGLGISGRLNAALGARGASFAPVVNGGINGARTDTLLRLLQSDDIRAAVQRADAVIVSIGGNDLFGDSRSRLITLLWPEGAISRTLGRVARVVRSVTRINPKARIHLLGLYDPYRGTKLERFLDEQIARWDARLIARFSKQPRVNVVRIADLVPSRARLSTLDGFHPGAAVYELIAARIAATIE
jgi:lysophospholipase L1-like esterase